MMWDVSSCTTSCVKGKYQNLMPLMGELDNPPKKEKIALSRTVISPPLPRLINLLSTPWTLQGESLHSTLLLNRDTRPASYKLHPLFSRKRNSAISQPHNLVSQSMDSYQLMSKPSESLPGMIEGWPSHAGDIDRL